MLFNTLVENAKEYFPDLQIKYKNESIFIKLLSKILFFNKAFMTSYVTTIGSTIYFPNSQYISQRPFSSSIILFHELIHIYDSKRLNKLLFNFLYLSPQILSLFCIPLIFFCWKLFLPLSLLFILPLPSWGRTYLEKRAYFVSLYVMNLMSIRYNYNSKLDKNKDYFSAQFKESNYYYMWIFNGLKLQFKIAVDKILSGNKPYEDPIFIIIDKLLEKI